MNPAHRLARFRCPVVLSEVPSRFAIITAFNPGDQTRPDRLNREADHQLAEEIDRLRLRRFRVTGGAPDFSHAEPGWGVEAEGVDPALQLGRLFGQVAIYWVEDDVLTLVDCGSGEREELGSWTERTVFGPAGST